MVTRVRRDNLSVISCTQPPPSHFVLGTSFVSNGIRRGFRRQSIVCLCVCVMLHDSGYVMYFWLAKRHMLFGVHIISAKTLIFPRRERTDWCEFQKRQYFFFVGSSAVICGDWWTVLLICCWCQKQKLHAKTFQFQGFVWFDVQSEMSLDGKLKCCGVPQTQECPRSWDCKICLMEAVWWLLSWD